MFKRVRWVSMGAAAGVGASFWAQYRLKRTLDEHPTARASVQAVAKARRLGFEVREAILDGRDAMAVREEALRAELDARLVPIRPEARLDAATRVSSRRRRDDEGSGQDSRLGADGIPADGTRLRVVDAPSQRLQPAEPMFDRALNRPPTAGHPSLGSGARDEPFADGPPAPTAARRAPWRRRR